MVHTFFLVAGHPGHGPATAGHGLATGQPASRPAVHGHPPSHPAIQRPGFLNLVIDGRLDIDIKLDIDVDLDIEK